MRARSDETDAAASFSCPDERRERATRARRIVSTGVGRVLSNPPFHERWRVKENPPYAGFMEGTEARTWFGRIGAQRRDSSMTACRAALLRRKDASCEADGCKLRQWRMTQSNSQADPPCGHLVCRLLLEKKKITCS